MPHKIRNYLELIRLPNSFTAISGVLSGYFIAGQNINFSVLLGLSLSSFCLYSGGIVFNDYFDINIDKKERPNRPLPSGRIPLKNALALGIALLIFGLLSGYLLGIKTFFISALIAISILLYDNYFKKIIFAGALLIAVCRFLNILLGMSISNKIAPVYLLFPAVISIYIFIITLLSRKENEKTYIKKIVKTAILFLIVIDSSFVFAFRDLTHAVVIISLLIPAVLLSKVFEVT